MPEDAFDTAFMRKLELLELVYRRLNGGGNAGEGPGRSLGGRAEFRGHRPYAAGDDFRTIDWNVFGRTESLFVKEHLREERRTVTVLLDCSASMAFGTPAKLTRGKQVAAAFAYLALVAGDEAVVAPFNDRLLRTVSVSGVKGRINEVLALLREIQAAGGTRPADALAARPAAGRRSLVVLVSDLLDADDCRRSIPALVAKGCEPCVIQLLSRDEMHPRITGRLRLTDAETGRTRSVWVEDAELKKYRTLLNEFIEDWRSFCARHNTSFVTAPTDLSFDELVAAYLRKGGLVR